MIRVLLVDDHRLVRTGLRRLLEDSTGISVVGEAETGEQGVQLARELKPDIILLDVNMPGIGGFEAAHKLLASDPRTRIIVLSAQALEPMPARLLEAGAAGYLTKACAADEVVTAVRRVHAGERYLSADVARGLAFGAVSGRSPGLLDNLSQRELQVMMMVGQGLSIQDISERLHLSPKTVSTYRYRLFEKLGVHNDVELTRLAIRHGLIENGTADGA
jgi:two-component system invasion response regulator UvrY